MSGRARGELVLLAALVAGLVVWLLRPAPVRTPAPTPLSSVLGALPETAAVVLTMDAAALRQTELGRRLLSRGTAHGAGRLPQDCAGDAVDSVREVGLFLPRLKGDEAMSFGLVARGDFRASVVMACLTLAMERTGKSPIAAPLGSFQSLRARERASDVGEYAVRDDGLLLLADSHLLRDLVDTAEGRLGSVQRDALHSGLRRAVGAGAVVVSAAIPQGFLASATDLPFTEASPLDRVRAAALRVSFVPRVAATVVLGCETEPDARAVADVLVELRKDLSPELTRALGDDVLRDAAITARGRLVFVELALDEARARRVAAALLGE